MSKRKILKVLVPDNCLPGYYEIKQADKILSIVEEELGTELRNWLLEIKDKKI